jgi:hypothetical protein
MGSDSSSGSSIHGSSTTAISSFPQSLPLLIRAILSMSEGPLGEQFLVVDHTANIMAGAKVSGIWHHGGERRRTLSKPVSA